jgi:DNA-binding NarL/FixJ family response regulator
MPRILIADDNELVRNALKNALTVREGWQVCGQATNGQSAVTMALETKPDFIILDFAMPLLNGIAAAAEIAKHLPSVPIVLYTLHKSEQIEREAKRVGIRGVISKTERFETFISGLEQYFVQAGNPIGPLQIGEITPVIEAAGNLTANPEVQTPEAKPNKTEESAG